MKRVITRAYNQIEIVEDDPTWGGPYIRKRSQTQRMADEIEYYLRMHKGDIPAKIYEFFPRLYCCNVTTKADLEAGGYHGMKIAYYPVDNLGNCLLAPDEWSTVFSLLYDIVGTFESYRDPVKTRDTEANARAMYVHKTIDEFDAYYELFDRNRFDRDLLFTTPTININGREYVNFITLWNDWLSKYIPSLLSYESTLIHGDLCFSNILYSRDTNFIKLIDPRGSFGDKGNYGDIRYDVAKLYHSIDGRYENIIYDEFQLTAHENKFALTYNGNSYHDLILDKFETTFFGTGIYDMAEIKIIEGLIFIGMCARHYDSFDRQMAMYLTGVRILNEGMDLYENAI